MVKEDVRLRLNAVKKHLEQGVRAATVCDLFGISRRTLKRWCHNYREEGVAGLRNQSRRPHRSPNRIHGNLCRWAWQIPQFWASIFPHFHLNPYLRRSRGELLRSALSIGITGVGVPAFRRTLSR